MINLIKKFWEWLNKPSPYGIWKDAFDKLQEEKEQNGRSSEYSRIWYKEVCPAYRRLTEGTPKFLRHPDTNKILYDIDKPLSDRKYY